MMTSQLWAKPLLLLLLCNPPLILQSRLQIWLCLLLMWLGLLLMWLCLVVCGGLVTSFVAHKNT